MRCPASPAGTGTGGAASNSLASDRKQPLTRPAPRRQAPEGADAEQLCYDCLPPIPEASPAAGRSVNDKQHADPRSGLRPYQVDVIARYRAEIAAGRRRILLVAPTGSGKTVIAAAIIDEAVQARHRVLFLAHRRELIVQCSRKLHALGLDHGILLPDHTPRPGEPVQVASIATLHARAIRTCKVELPPADLVVIDEAHHALARTYQRIVEAYPGAVILGLTATPCRGDGRGLGNVFDVIVECPSVAELIDAGHLVGTSVYAPSRPDLSGIRLERGDYVESQLAERVNTDRLVGGIVEHWLKLAERRPTVVFGTGVAHSLHIRDEFRRADVLAEHIDGKTPLDERDRILAQLAKGEIELVTNAMVLTEGWDQPSVSCLVLARPTKSLALYRQMIGRVLRPHPGKDHALILDHAGATFAHGFAEDPIEWTLSEDRPAENKAHAARGESEDSPSLANCPECFAVMLRGRYPCPACGWRPQPKPEAFACADGELAHVQRDRTTTPNIHTQADKNKFYGQLLWIAKERKYKPGWAGHKFKEKFGSWPPTTGCVPEMPDAAVRAWVRSRAIAYAKAMDAQRRSGGMQ